MPSSSGAHRYRSSSLASASRARPGTLASYATTQQQKTNTRLGAAGYAFTRSRDAADLSMAAMTSWRRTAPVKSGTVWVPLSTSAAKAA